MAEDTLFSDIDEIIKLAENFKCCPICGFEDAKEQYCKKCKEKYDERETSFFFGSYLRKIKKRGDLNNISKREEGSQFSVSPVQVD